MTLVAARGVVTAETWTTSLPEEPFAEIPQPSSGALELVASSAPQIDRQWEERRSRARSWVRRADLAVIVLALCVLHVQAMLRTLSFDFTSLSMVSVRLTHALVLFTCAYLWVKIFQVCGLYAARGTIALRHECRLLFLSSLLGVAVTVLLHSPIKDAVAYHGPDLFGNAALLWGFVVTLTVVNHTLAWRFAELPAQRSVRRILIVGSGPRAVNHYHALKRDTTRRNEVVGFVDVMRHSALSAIDTPLIGRLHELEDVLARTVVDEVYVALPMRSCYNEFQRTIHICERLGVRASYSMDAFEYRVSAPKYHQVGGTPVAMLTPVVRDAHLPFKRAIDIIIAGMALAILSPVLLLIAALVRVTTPGPIFFAQERYGQHKRRFHLYKFRSMRIDAEEVLRSDPVLWNEYRRNHFKLPEERDPRITPIGKILRKTSLDELPQLWNVLVGDMSVIGPRPIVPAEIEHYGPFATLLLALKPGLTGAWVIQGRSTVGYPRRAEIELSYVRQWSLLHDLRIFLRTIPAVLVGRGAH